MRSQIQISVEAKILVEFFLSIQVLVNRHPILILVRSSKHPKISQDVCKVTRTLWL